MNVGLTFLIVIVIAIFLIIAISIYENRINKNLNVRGILTTAIIISQKIVRLETDFVNTTIYTIRFYDTNNKAHKARFEFKGDSPFSVGKEIEIIYDPLKPKCFRFKGHKYRILSKK